MSIFKQSSGSKSKFQRGGYDPQFVREWQTTNESASSSLNSYFNTINNGGYLTSDDFKKYRKSLDDYIETSNRLREVSKTYGQSYSEEDEKKWTDTINGLYTDFDNASKWYSQFGSKEFFEDYNIGAEALQKEIDELETAKTEIGNLKSKINQAKTQKGRGNSTVSESDIKSLETKLKDLEGKYGDNLNGDYLARKRSSLTRINEMTEFAGLSSVAEAEDFAYYSAEGSKVKDTSMKWETVWDAMDWQSLDRSDITNIVTFAEEHKAEAAADSLKALMGYEVSDLTNLINRINLHMKDDEKNLYNYYIGKGDIESANRYMSHIEDILLQREAGKIVEQIDDTALELVFSSIAGAESFFTGLGNIDNMIMGTDPDPTTTSTQYAHSMMSSNNGLIWGAANDLAYTTSNMLPSILVGSIPVVGQVAGVTTMGLSATGNAYAEMRNLGYTDAEAQRYSVMVGVSEAALQHALGGISKLGGKVSGNAIDNAVSKVDNAIARTALKIGGNMLSEGFEESIQSVLEPIFKSIVTGENVDIDWGEVAYSGVLGALSAGLLESGSTIAGEVGTYKQGKVIKESGVENVERLKSLGSTFAPETVAHQLAGKVNEQTGAYTIGRLLNEVGASLSEKNMADITAALEAKGMRSEDSQTIAKWLNKAVNGGYFNKSQVEALESNEIISEVFREVVFDGNSIVNQRMQTYAELQPSNIIAKAEATEKAVGEKLKESTESSEVDVKSRISKSGKTTLTSTGEAIVINKDNPIAKTETVDGKRKVYYNTDKGKVESSDVSYANETEGLIHESFVDMGASIANAVIKNYDGKTPVQTYIKGMREGVLVYGMHNFQGVGKDISSATFFADLSSADQAIALRIGRSYASTVANKQESVIKSAVKKAEEQAKASEGASTDTSVKKTAKKGKVSFENGAKALSKNQQRSVALAKHLASATGIDIVFYDAKTTKYKHGEDANGFFDPNTDTIYLDLQNAEDDGKTIVFTMSHELVHFIKKWSPAKFDTLAKFLMENYASHGVSTSQLLANKMEKLGTKDANEAYEEMIADACETMLLDSNAVYKLMELRKADLGLFEKIKLHIHELLTKIRDAYKKLGLQPSSDEAKGLSKMTDVLEQMYALFEEASVEAVQNYQAVESLDTEAVSMSEDGTIRMQMKQYQQTGRSTLLNYLREQYGADNANDLISTIDSIYDTLAEIKKDTALSVFGNWQDSDVELDENGHPIFTTSIKNGDYELNQDFSRVCKKRRQLNFVLNMLAEDPAFEASNLTKEDFVKINEAIKSHGFEIACALCFVDSKRFRQTEWADSFANTWNDILYAVVEDKSKLTPFNFATKNPNLADDGIKIDTSKAVTYRKWSDGKEDVKNRRTYGSFDQMLAKGSNGKFLEGNANVRAIVTLIRDNPSLRHTFRGADIIASDGFDSIQRLAPGIRSILDGWGGTSVPKPSSNDAIYDNSILNIAGYNAKKAFAVGGVRMNSFSDFMAHMFFDYAQAFADLSAKGLPMHSYTKELDFARLFGLTGGKINMSAIAAIRSNATDLDKIKKKADKDKATEFEKSIAGLDISRLAEKLGKAESEITYDDVIKNLDDVDYVWADESINVQSATLLQSGILYDNLTEGQAAYCYELIRQGKFDEAYKVAGEANVNKGYAKNLGIITVGVSKAHILKLLRDPTIRMVIPYHKSGLNATIAKALKIAFYDDFTDVQNTTFKQGATKVGISSDGAKISGKNLKDFPFYDWFGKTVDGVFYDGKATASKYLEWCEKGTYDESVGDYVYYFTGNGGYILASDLHAKGIEIIPKFSEFSSEENYYKVVEDFDCYDTITGEHSSQEAVDIFHDGLPSDYKKVLVRALKAEQKVSDDFKYHLDNKGLRNEVMKIVKARGYKPSVKKQAKRVKAGMSESERYSVLKDSKIIAITDLKSETQPIHAEIEKVPEKAKGQVEKLIKDLADDLEILNVPLSTAELDIEFQLSKNNGLKESLSQQLKYGGNFHDFSKALINLRDILNRAILVEVHTEDRYKGTEREDINFEAGYVLFSAFKSKEYVIPVKLEIKQKKDVQNILYVVVSMTKIERISVMESALDNPEGLDIPLSDTDSVYSLSHLVSKVNPQDRHFLKYLPDQMLSTEQITAKRLALKEDKDKLDALQKKSDSVKKQVKKTNSEAESLYKEFLVGLGATEEDVKSASFAEYMDAWDETMLDPISSLYTYADEVLENKRDNYLAEGMEEDEAYDRATKDTRHLYDIVDKLSSIHNEKSYKSNVEVQAEAVKTPTTWRDEAKAFYEMFYDQVSDSLKKEMPSFEEIMSYEKGYDNSFDPKSPLNKLTSLYVKMNRNLDKDKRDTLSKAMHSLNDLMVHHKVVFDYFNRYTDRPDLVYSIKKQAKKNTDRILMGSLFSGGGTLEAGLTYQMLDKEFGVEYDGKIASVYADNHGDHIQVGKVEDFDISRYKDIFYLHASPVCHNFSKAKHGAAELQMDKDSARATAMHLEMGMPQVFTVENAPGYLKSESLKIITDKLTELGYKWDADVYNSADYGSATSRNRVILRAVKDGELPPKPTKRERTNSWDKVTRDLWNTLPKSTLRPSFISAIENTPKLPILDANGKVNVNKPLLILTTTSGHTVTYCWEGEICPTLTTKCGEAKLVMPDGNIYAVTPEFMGRIQGLPDDYKYPKEKTRAFTIIGNGIPTHLTKAVVGGVLDSAYEQTHDGRVLYQKKKVSDRTILANALELAVDVSTQKGQTELKMLREYQSKVSEMEKEEAHLAEVKAEIYKISFTKGSDRSKLAALNDDKIKTQNRIHTYDRQLTRLEAMKPIKDVLEREKELVRKETEEKGREALKTFAEKMMKVQKERIGEERVKKAMAIAKVRETRDKGDARTKLQKLVLDTVKWITRPAKTDVRCPDMLKEPYAKFLNSIDLSSNRALKGGDATHNDLRVASAMESLATTIERIRTAQISEDASNGGLDSGFLDLPGEFITMLRDMAENIKKMMVGEGHTINRMTSTEIKQISNAIRTLNHSIKVMSELNANLRFANAQALGGNSMTFLDKMGEAKETNIVKDFVTWDNALPYYAFKKFGEGGESIMEELMDAQDKMAFHAQSILEFKEKTWTDKEAREWGEDTHTIELPSGNSITLTTANAMGIYCLARRDNEQGMNHLVGGGVRIVGLTKGSNKMKDTRVNLTYEDVNAIINSLSDRQKNVAETIQEFMSTDCAKWGNEISMKRFLTRDFVEKQYYPIESDNENLNTELPEASQGDLYRLLNISATKALTKGANNRVVIRDIFDVFTAHSSDMARLNAYGMALLDYMKWINYREKVTKDNGQIETRGVRQSMNSAYGGKALGYVMNLIKDINGRAGDAGTHPLFSKWAKAAKTASVGGNLRVALLQITAYPRAGMVLSLGSLAKGLTKAPQISKARKYCGIALWKSFGFFDTNIARSIEDQIKGAKNIRSKIIEFSMKGAEVADAVTWGALWNACEYEVAKTTKNKIGSEEFNYEVGKKLREVVYATQVVDSVLTRSQLMRSKDGVNQLLTAYMSEPTVTANILADAWWRVRNAKKLGLKGVKKHVGRVLGYYVTGAVFTTLMESLADAVRDDDEGEEFYEKFIEHFGGNLIDNVNPFNNIPYISDVIEAAKSLITGDRYYTSEMLQSQWITKSYYAINAWKLVFNGKGDVADALYKSAQAFSFITGIPISNVWRDIMAIWETAKGLAD